MSVFNFFVGSIKNVSGSVAASVDDVTPDAFTFDAAYNVSDQNITDSHTIGGVDTPITISWSTTGSETFAVTKNGSGATSGTTTWSNTDVLAFTITEGATTGSGTVTFTNNSDSGATLDSFTYEIFVTDVTPGAFTFDASYSATDNDISDTHTINQINSPITIAWSNTGSETLSVTKNGSAATSGSTTWEDGDILGFLISEGASTGSGTVTFTNQTDGSATLDSFTYTLTVTDVTPAAFSFDASYSATDANITDSHTITGINSPITIAWSTTGSETLAVTKNGSAATSGTTTWSNSDVLAFTITKDTSTGSGTVSFTNQTDGNASLDSFTYTITIPTNETFSITAGQDDIKSPVNFGYDRGVYGSISPTGKFLDIYGTDDHQVDAVSINTTTDILTFEISGDSTVTNSGWTSISVPKSTGGTVTLNRSAATYTNLATTGGRWTWSSQSGYSIASGTVTITI
jgi:hypothetical protein